MLRLVCTEYRFPLPLSLQPVAYGSTEPTQTSMTIFFGGFWPIGFSAPAEYDTLNVNKSSWQHSASVYIHRRQKLREAEMNGIFTAWCSISVRPNGIPYSYVMTDSFRSFMDGSRSKNKTQIIVRANGQCVGTRARLEKSSSAENYIRQPHITWCCANTMDNRPVRSHNHISEQMREAQTMASNANQTTTQPNTTISYGIRTMLGCLFARLLSAFRASAGRRRQHCSRSNSPKMRMMCAYI